VKITYQVVSIENKNSFCDHERVLIEYDTLEECEIYILHRVVNYNERCYIRKVYSRVN